MYLRWNAYLLSLLICAAIALIALPFAEVIDGTNIAMVFLLAVAFVAARFGSGPAAVASVAAVALFDFFFVPPRFSWSVVDAQYLITFAVMLVVGFVIGRLTARLAERMRDSEQREAQTRALYGMARELSGVLMNEQVVESVGRFIKERVGANARLHLAPLTEATPDVRLVYESGMPVEIAGTTLLLPLSAPMRRRGVLQVDAADPPTLLGDQRPLLEAVASLAAIAFERIHYVEVAQEATLRMESEKLRAALLSAVSHDLRTPLTVMVGLADALTLVNPPLPESQRAAAAALREESRRLSGLVENLLQMARLQAGRSVLRKEWQPLEEVVGASLQALTPVLRDREVKVDLAPDLPLLEFDAVLLERVFCNLLENAVKYAPEGDIAIMAGRVDGSVEISVCDCGPGVPAGGEEALFSLFERGNRDGDGSGVGLGLAICRAIVEDEPQIRAFVCAALADDGYARAEAANAAEALERIAERRPELLVLDLGLPDRDGLELISEVRTWSALPILVLSARTAEDMKIDALDAGADDYLAKPFGIGKLRARVRAMLRRRRIAVDEPVVEFGNLRVDHVHRTVERNGTPVHLTPIEHRLLSLFIANADRVMTHRQLLREVWGPGCGERSHYLRVYVGHLRQKLEDDPNRPKHLLTETGVGYRFKG